MFRSWIFISVSESKKIASWQGILPPGPGLPWKQHLLMCQKLTCTQHITHSRIIYSRGNAFYVISFWCSLCFLKNTFRAKILLIPTIQLLTIVSFVLMFKNSDFRFFFNTISPGREIIYYSLLHLPLTFLSPCLRTDYGFQYI